MKAYLDVLHKFWGLKMSSFFWHMLTHYNNMKHIHISSTTKGFFSSFHHWFLVPLLRLQTLKWSTPPVLSYTVQYGVCVWHRRISQQSEQQKFCPRNSSFGLCAEFQCLDSRTQKDTFSNKEVNKRSSFTLSTPFSFPVRTGPFSEVISTIIFNQSASLSWKFFRGKKKFFWYLVLLHFSWSVWYRQCMCLTHRVSHKL